MTTVFTDITKLDNEWKLYQPALARLTARTEGREEEWDRGLVIEARHARSGVYLGIEVRVVFTDCPDMFVDPVGIEWWAEVDGRVQHVTMPRLRRHDSDATTWLAVEDETWQPEIKSVGPRAMWWWAADEMPSEVTL